MDSVLFSVKDNVGWIILNRPDKFNAFNRSMALLLQGILDDCAAQSAIRAVCITGAGKAFCAGQDLAEVVDPNGPGMEKILSEHFNPIALKIKQLEKPVLAAVNGIAAGAGANLALCCDIVVAAEQAGFIQAFSKIGLIPDTGGTYILPRLIGWQKAKALMMLGEKVSAQDAAAMGMIYKMIPNDNFQQAFTQLAIQLAGMPTKALGYTKNALELSANHTFIEQLALEDSLQQKAAATQDFKEGVQSFLEKRSPVFKGN